MLLKEQFSKIPKSTKVKYGLTYKDFVLNYVKSKVETFRDLNKFLKDLSSLLGKPERFNKILNHTFSSMFPLIFLEMLSRKLDFQHRIF